MLRQWILIGVLCSLLTGCTIGPWYDYWRRQPAEQQQRHSQSRKTP